MPISLTVRTSIDRQLEACLQSILDSHQSPPIQTDLSLYRSAKKALGLEMSGTIVTVTGTNGKGSTVKCLEAIYLAAGYRVAATTSPHLTTFCERLTLNGCLVDPAWVIEALQRVLALDTRQMSYFGIVYLALCLCIQRFSPHIILLEVGVGGRLDPNNIFDTDVAVITSIGLDHQRLLGDTREAIGWEKAWLARAGKPLVCGERDMPHAVAQVCDEVGANLICINSAFEYISHLESWVWRGANQAYIDLPKPIIKLQNAATALQVIDSLQSCHPVPRVAIDQGLQQIDMSGRFEHFYRKDRLLILDVGHNPQAMAWLGAQLEAQSCQQATWCLVGMKRDKAVKESIQALMPMIDHWVATSIQHESSCAPEEIASVLATAANKNCYTYNSLESALNWVFKESQPGDRIVICGSFFLVGQAKAYLEGEFDE